MFAEQQGDNWNMVRFVFEHLQARGHNHFVSFFVAVLCLTPCERDIQYLRFIQTPSAVCRFILEISTGQASEQHELARIYEHGRTFLQNLEALRMSLIPERHDGGTVSGIWNYDSREGGGARYVEALGSELAFTVYPWAYEGFTVSYAKAHASIVSTMAVLVYGCAEANDWIAYGHKMSECELPSEFVFPKCCSETMCDWMDLNECRCYDVCQFNKLGSYLFSMVFLDGDYGTYLTARVLSGQCLCTVFGQVPKHLCPCANKVNTGVYDAVAERVDSLAEDIRVVKKTLGCSIY